MQNLSIDSEKQRAGQLFSDVLSTFKRKQHRETFEVMMNLFLTGQGQPLPHLATVKSPSAVSRFLNQYTWNIRAVIRAMRQHALDAFDLFRRTRSGRQYRLELIVDMTSLHTEGKFEQLSPWVHHFNGVTGVHLVVLYVCRGSRRFPWSFLIWRGKGQPSPADLALKMLARLPDELVKRHSRVPLVLADAGFCSKALIAGIVQLGLAVSVTIPANRVTAAGWQVRQVRRQGEAIILPGLPDLQRWLYWIWLSNSEGGAREKRYVVSTLHADPYTIRANGRRRWRLEAFFKTLKSRFGLHRSGQYTNRGMLRYDCLCFLSYILCHLETLEDAAASSSVCPLVWRPQRPTTTAVSTVAAVLRVFFPAQRSAHSASARLSPGSPFSELGFSWLPQRASITRSAVLLKTSWPGWKDVRYSRQNSSVSSRCAPTDSVAGVVTCCCSLHTSTVPFPSRRTFLDRPQSSGSDPCRSAAGVVAPSTLSSAPACCPTFAGGRRTP